MLDISCRRLWHRDDENRTIEIIGNTETIKDPFLEEEKKLNQVDPPENIETE